MNVDSEESLSQKSFLELAGCDNRPEISVESVSLSHGAPREPDAVDFCLLSSWEDTVLVTTVVTFDSAFRLFVRRFDTIRLAA